MAESNDNNDLRRVNFRLCQLCIWPDYGGLGFNLENAISPPHIIRTVESNSPAAAGGLKILDVVLAVNNQDVSGADYSLVTQAIKNARDSNGFIELLVIEKRYYQAFKDKGISFDPTLAKLIKTPRTMPDDYRNFPKYTPRICEIRLTRSDQSFGFEVVNGIRETGAFIQEVVPNSPAGKTSLRKSDRILEIDDKFVDNEPSKIILDRLFKAKKKRSVKLYVVDTNTYKYFQENKIPLTSKEFRKSKFAQGQQQQPPSTYINVEDISTEPKSADVDIPRPLFPTQTSRDNQQSIRSENSSIQEPNQDDIRLCTITRTDATDPYGIELNYHKREKYHSLKLTSGRDNQPSNAALAGVKTNDHLIEINGQNIEKVSDEEVKQRIRAIKYPQPLQVLVADAATYKYYKQQNKLIHNGLPTVKKLPENIIDQSTSLVTSYQESNIPSNIMVSIVPTKEPSPVISQLVVGGSAEPRMSIESSQSNRRQYQLQRIPGFSGYGFSVNSNHARNIAHKITNIAPNSPAAQQGLRVGDYIVKVNNTNVEKMNAVDFNQFLRASAQNADASGNPLLLEVINEDSYQLPTLSDDFPTQHSIADPPSTITSIRSAQPVSSREGSRKSTITQPTLSRDGSRKSATTQPTIYRNGSRKLTSTQPTTSRDESQKLTTTQPSVLQDAIHKSAPSIQPTAALHRSQNLPTTQLTSNQPYMNGYASPPHEPSYPRPDIRPSGTLSPSSYRSRENLSRAAVDVVSKNRLLRYCRLSIGPGQAFGFQLKSENNKHIAYNIQPDSPAARAGLDENDCLIEVDDQDVENKSNQEVANLIRNATHHGTLRLFIAPNNVKVLSKRSAKSLSSLNDDHYYRDSTLRSKYNDQKRLSTGRHGSIPRLHDEQNNRDQSYAINNSINYSSEPTEPLPRKCVLKRDLSFRGCGFRITEKENYDTPIVIEIFPNSPAQRSGLAEGDHIIYIDSQNVQNFPSFNDITHLIQQIFEENGQITLITLTGPGYQVLKRRGGYLESTAFDYQSSNVDQLKPRLCKLKLYNHEHDFGFTLHRNNYLYIKNVEEGSPADVYGLRKDDIILEINGKIEKYLTLNQIKDIIETSKKEQKLDILVIDNDGYRFSMKHAIPLNSLLSFVQTGEEQAITTNTRIKQQPVYL